MRKILFRGKRLYNCGWVFGGFHSRFGQSFIIGISKKLRIDGIQVYTETVGQYTGLTDKNGTKIFEGDVIMYGLIPCVVKWEEENARFMLYEKGVYLRNGFNADTMKLKEVIGNIHDNPELLEVTE